MIDPNLATLVCLEVKKKIIWWFYILLFCLESCFLHFVVFKLVSFILKENTFLKRFLWKSIPKIHLNSLGSKVSFKKYATISYSVCTLLFLIKIWFWMEHESKLVVPNEWDNSRLYLCISIGDMVKPYVKIIFQKPFIVNLLDLLCI